MTEKNEPPPRGFPYVTALATLLALFFFVGLLLLAFREPSAAVGPDPYTKRSDVEARNRAVLAGKEPGVKPMAQALPEYAAKVKAGQFPFPSPPKAGEKK